MLKKAFILTILGFVLLLFLAYFRYVYNKPYNLLADSKSDITETVSNLDNNQLLIVVLGANWCPECRLLSNRIESEPLSHLNGTALSFVKVDVNGWDRNMDIVEKLGHPAGGGIPAIAIIDNQSRVLATRTGKQLSKDKDIKGSYYEYFSWLSETYINGEYNFDTDDNVFRLNLE